MLQILFYRTFFLSLNYWLILLNSCSYCTNFFDLIAEFVIPIGIPSKDAKAEIETHTVTAEA